MTVGVVWTGAAVTAVHGAEDDLDPALREVVASAVSARRTLMVQVNGFGFVCGLRLLSPVVRTWDRRRSMIASRRSPRSLTTVTRQHPPRSR
jgi:hypothetical protein